MNPSNSFLGPGFEHGWRFELSLGLQPCFGRLTLHFYVFSKAQGSHSLADFDFLWALGLFHFCASDLGSKQQCLPTKREALEFDTCPALLRRSFRVSLTFGYAHVCRVALCRCSNPELRSLRTFVRSMASTVMQPETS